MNYGKTLGQYQKTKVITAGKMDLIVMCYEKAVQSLQQIKVLIEEKEYEKKAKKLQKVLDIIEELQGSLNHEKGGQIAKNLNSIYTFLTKHLLQGDIRKDITVYDDAISILIELKEAWETIASASKNQNMQNVKNSSMRDKIDISQVAA